MVLILPEIDWPPRREANWLGRNWARKLGRLGSWVNWLFYGKLIFWRKKGVQEEKVLVFQKRYWLWVLIIVTKD